MDDNKNNKSFDKNTFKTPKAKNKTLCLRKSKSSYGTLKLETEPSTTSKKPFSTKTHIALKSKILTHNNSIQHFHTNSSKLLNKTYDSNKNTRLSIQTETKKLQSNCYSDKIVKTDGNKKKNIKTDKNDSIKKMKIKKKILEKGNENIIKKDQNDKNNKNNKNKENDIKEKEKEKNKGKEEKKKGKEKEKIKKKKMKKIKKKKMKKVKKK